ncbi:hypothetical protein [Streptomyces sp. NPDC005283]|uniref:hypothetical protein n=1 Tax=Streptomyces sp. NPDC005283 TaxID=3156871 RepID=UPI00345550ED
MAKRTSAAMREEAARLLAGGWSTDAVGLRIGVRGSTIRSWRLKDPEFQALLQQYLDGLYARGVQLAAERGVPLVVRARPGASPTETARNVMTDIARKEARRGR